MAWSSYSAKLEACQVNQISSPEEITVFFVANLEWGSRISGSRIIGFSPARGGQTSKTYVMFSN